MTDDSTWRIGEALKLMRSRDPERFEIIAICDIDAEAAKRYRQRFGAGRTYTDAGEMLAAEKLDALMAITPIALTERIVTDLLPKGVPLLIEKPPGGTAAATQRLVAAAAACGTSHMVSLNRRFAPALRKARDWIAAEADRRKPRMILGRMLRKNRLEDDFLSATAIHQVDAVLSILGRPTGVRCRHRPAGKDAVLIADWQADFVDGGRASCLVAPDAGVLEETYEIIGEDYSIAADVLTGHVAVRQSGSVAAEWAPPTGTARVERDGTLAETEAFFRAVEGRGPFAPALAETVWTMRTTEAVAAGGDHRRP